MPRKSKNLPAHWRKLLYGHPSTKGGRNVDDVSLWKNSVYYLWWEYLRRNEGYRRACGKKRKGEFAEVFSDFGDIYSEGFIPWWHGRGRALFSEPQSDFYVREVIHENDEHEYGDERFVILEVPLNKHLWRLEREFRKFIDQEQKKRGLKFTGRPSSAKYPVWVNPVTKSLTTGLKIWDMRTEGDDQAYWQIGEKTGVRDGFTKKKLAKARKYLSEKDIRDLRHDRLATATYRHFNQAERRIYWVGRGFFPRDDEIPT